MADLLMKNTIILKNTVECFEIEMPDKIATHLIF